jgi:hypothetical protein
MIALLSYTVDAAGRIVEIDGPWDAFAARNGAPDLMRDAVLSRPLLSFVTGRDMQVLVSALLSRVRSGEPLALEFRCDSPEERRYVLFEAFPLPEAAVLCATSLIRSEPRAPQALIDAAAPRSGRVVVLCSWCLRVKAGAGWLEIEDGVRALGLLAEEPVPQVSHGICPACLPLLRGGQESA